MHFLFDQHNQQSQRDESQQRKDRERPEVVEREVLIKLIETCHDGIEVDAE